MDQRDVVIYTTMYCSYCLRAKALLDRKNIAYLEIPVDGDTTCREELRMRSGGRSSVPQIFVHDQHIGGCDDLYALDQAGKLDPILFQSAS